MTGYIPEPDKNLLDYLNQAQRKRFRKSVAVLKLFIGIITLVIIPLSITVYLILMVAARKFFLSDIPDMCEDVIRYSTKMIKSGWFDLFHRVD